MHVNSAMFPVLLSGLTLAIVVSVVSLLIAVIPGTLLYIGSRSRYIIILNFLKHLLQKFKYRYITCLILKLLA